MELWLSNGDIVKDVDLNAVISALDNLRTSEENHFSLFNEEGDYIDVNGSADGGIRLESSGNKGTRIYQSVDSINIEKARAIISDFFNGQSDWRSSLEWVIIETSKPSADKSKVPNFVKTHIVPLINLIGKLFSDKFLGIPGGIWLIGLVCIVSVYFVFYPSEILPGFLFQNGELICIPQLALLSSIATVLLLITFRYTKLTDQFIAAEAVIINLKMHFDLGDIEKPRFARVCYETPKGTVKRWFRVTKFTLMNLRIGDRVKIKHHPRLARMGEWAGGRIGHSIRGIDAWKNVKTFKRELYKWKGADKKYFKRGNFKTGIIIGFSIAVVISLIDLIQIVPDGKFVPVLLLGSFLLRFIGWSLFGLITAGFIRSLLYREQRLRPYRNDLSKFIRYEPVTGQNLVDCPYCSTPILPGVWYCPYCGMAISLIFLITYISLFLVVLPMIALVTGHYIIALKKALPLFVLIGYGIRDGLIWYRVRHWQTI